MIYAMIPMTLDVWLSLLPYLTSAGISLWVFILAWRRRRHYGGLPLALVTISEAVITIAFIFQLITPGLYNKFFFNNVLYFGAVVAPLGYFGFAIEYHQRLTNSRRPGWLMLLPLTVALLAFIWTDGLHHLFRINPQVISQYPFDILTFMEGPGYAAFTIYTYSLIIISTLLLLVAYMGSQRLFRQQIGLLLFSVLLPLAVSLAAATGWLPSQPYDFIPLSFGVSNLIIAFAIFRYHLLEIIPISRDQVMESIPTAMLVLDMQQRVMDANPAVQKLLGRIAKNLLGKPISRVLPLPTDWLSGEYRNGERVIEFSLPIQGEIQTIRSSGAQMLNHAGGPAGFVITLQNVHAQKLDEQEIQHRMAILHSACETAVNGILIIDNEKNILLNNRRMEFIFDLPYEWEKMADQARLNRLAEALVEPDELETLFVSLQARPAAVHTAEFHLPNKRILECLATPFYVEGVREGWMLTFRDATDSKLAERRLVELAATDPLTRVYNRSAFYSLAEIELGRAKRYKRDLAMILFDIDHFKQINDTFGHRAGDQMLETLADQCRSNLRSSDIIGRYGGEEFIILLPETNLEKAEQIAERLRQQAEEIRIPNQRGEAKITLSLGVTRLVGGAEIALDTLVSLADEAMYCAKQGGRNQVCRMLPEQIKKSPQTFNELP